MLIVCILKQDKLYILKHDTALIVFYTKAWYSANGYDKGYITKYDANSLYTKVWYSANSFYIKAV